jgi:hypothetical protein
VAEPLAGGGRALALALLLLVASTACRSEEDQLREHRRQLQSIRSTAIQVGDAWLAGQVSSTYAVAALEATSRLLEQERASLASHPERLARPPVAALLSEIDSTAHALGGLIDDVGVSNPGSVRERLASLADGGSVPP